MSAKLRPHLRPGPRPGGVTAVLRRAGLRAARAPELLHRLNIYMGLPGDGDVLELTVNAARRSPMTSARATTTWRSRSMTSTRRSPAEAARGPAPEAAVPPGDRDELPLIAFVADPDGYRIELSRGSSSTPQDDARFPLLDGARGANPRAPPARRYARRRGPAAAADQRDRRARSGCGARSSRPCRTCGSSPTTRRAPAGSETPLLPLTSRRSPGSPRAAPDELGCEQVDVPGYSFGGIVAQRTSRAGRRPYLLGWCWPRPRPARGGVRGSPAVMAHMATPLRYYSRAVYDRTIGDIAVAAPAPTGPGS